MKTFLRKDWFNPVSLETSLTTIYFQPPKFLVITHSLTFSLSHTQRFVQKMIKAGAFLLLLVYILNLSEAKSVVLHRPQPHTSFKINATQVISYLLKQKKIDSLLNLKGVKDLLMWLFFVYLLTGCRQMLLLSIDKNKLFFHHIYSRSCQPCFWRCLWQPGFPSKCSQHNFVSVGAKI